LNPSSFQNNGRLAGADLAALKRHILSLTEQKNKFFIKKNKKQR